MLSEVETASGMGSTAGAGRTGMAPPRGCFMGTEWRLTVHARNGLWR